MSELLEKIDALLEERKNYGISGDARLSDWRWRAAAELPKIAEELRQTLLQVSEAQMNERAKILKGLWHLLRAYAGGGMPPAITKGIKLACQNAGMSEDHIASAELGGDDPDFIKRETEKRVASSKNDTEAFVVQLCHGDKADGLYYDGDGDWTNFENACTYYSHHDIDEVLREARGANEDKTAEVVAFSVILSRR